MKCLVRLAILLTLALSLTSHLFASTTITVGTAPMYLAVNPTTNRVYVCNSISNSVSVIDGSSNTVVATVPLSASPDGIDVNPTTNMIYVALFLTGEVVVIDGSSNTIVTTIKGVDAFRVAVDAATNRIYGPQFLFNQRFGNRWREQHDHCQHPSWEGPGWCGHRFGGEPYLCDQ